MYPEYARDTFTGWKLAHRNADFTLNVDRVIEAIAEVKPSMVLLTSPNNPTGTPLPMADIERILAACATADVAGAGEGVHPILVIDEAYVEFRKPGTPSAVSLIKNHPNLAVSRTMSKAFAFAGARVGYLAASKGIIDCVRIVRMPYHLSVVTQAAALAAFEHTDEQLSRVEHLREIRESTAEWLSRPTYKGSRSKWLSPVRTSCCSVGISTTARPSSTSCSGAACSSAWSARTAGCACAWAPTRRWNNSVTR